MMALRRLSAKSSRSSLSDVVNAMKVTKLSTLIENCLFWNQYDPQLLNRFITVRNSSVKEKKQQGSVFRVLKNFHLGGQWLTGVQIPASKSHIWIEFVVVLSFAPGTPGFPLLRKQHFQISLCECATSKSLYLYLSIYLLIYLLS